MIRKPDDVVAYSKTQPNEDILEDPPLRPMKGDYFTHVATGRLFCMTSKLDDINDFQYVVVSALKPKPL